MTLEHLPARSAGNNKPMRMCNDTGTIVQDFLDGLAIPTLCGDCNGGASRRNLPGAYKLWRNDVIEAVRSTTARQRPRPSFNIWRTGLVVDVDHEYALHPGRVVRQVLGMVLAVQATRDLVVADETDGSATRSRIALTLWSASSMRVVATDPT